MGSVRIAVAETSGGGGVLAPLAADGSMLGPPEPVADLRRAIDERERAMAPRWTWPATSKIYPALLHGGVRVARCHDLRLTEALLLGHAGRPVVPPEHGGTGAEQHGSWASPAGAGPAQEALFDHETDPAGARRGDISAVVAAHADQLRRIAAAGAGFGALVAAESAGALVAAEMTRHGVPWSADRHDEILTGLLGPRPVAALRPRRLQELADQITAAFGGTVGGGQPVNPDSPAQLLRAFAAAGVPVPSTRAHVLRRVDHPAVQPLLAYKELARLHSAHGWTWLDAWVRGGRFRPEYVVGGVVSGRWASRGGGALQIPRVLRGAVIADPGWALVVADAAQLEPRVLAALAGDRAFAAAAAAGDLYQALAPVFGSVAAGGDPRGQAKIALLSAMYGGGTGEAPRLLAVLRDRFPDAFGYVEAAARTGEAGGLVRSRLGRTCPPPPPGFGDLRDPHDADDDGRETDAARRSRGRFTRNFVVQATAAEWALVLLALLRQRLHALGGLGGPGGLGGLGGLGAAGHDAPQLVFFQHDEVIVHTPRRLAAEVAAAITECGTAAGRVLFGATPVLFPIEAKIVDCYADAK